MSLSEIKREVDRLPDNEQRELLLYLAHQREIRDPAYLDTLTEMLDDTSGDRWVPFETIKTDKPEA